MDRWDAANVINARSPSSPRSALITSTISVPSIAGTPGRRRASPGPRRFAGHRRVIGRQVPASWRCCWPTGARRRAPVARGFRNSRCYGDRSRSASGTNRWAFGGLPDIYCRCTVNNGALASVEARCRCAASAHGDAPSGPAYAVTSPGRLAHAQRTTVLIDAAHNRR